MYIKFILLAIGIILYLVLFVSAANYLIVSSLNMNSNSDVV
jgi:hypothetical protein